MIPVTCIVCMRTSVIGSSGGFSWRRIDLESGLGVCAWCSDTEDFNRFNALIMIHGLHPHARACFRCRSVVVVLTTTRNRNVAVDASYVRPGDRVLDLARHAPHLATCKQVRELSSRSHNSEGL